MKQLVFFVITSCIGLSSASEWSYDYETQWPGMCRSGKQQSPINIMSGDAYVDQFGSHIRGPLEFRGYGDVRLHASNTGHTLKWTNMDGSPAPVVAGGPLRGNYTFLQFHLHWLSEHAIDGMKFPLEIHMVHVKTGLTIDEALNRDDGLAVIGVLCQVVHESGHTNALDQIVKELPNLIHHTEKAIDSNLIDLSQLFSPDPQSFYTYHGSLTTPECQEVVTWIVMDKPVSISNAQYKLFGNVDFGRLDNYRSLQPVNRVVYRSVASCGSMLVPGVLALLTSSLQCLAANIASIIKKGLCTVYNAKKRILGGQIKECQFVN